MQTDIAIKFYYDGCEDGYDGAPERAFDSSVAEKFKEEYSRGYREGAEYRREAENEGNLNGSDFGEDDRYDEVFIPRGQFPSITPGEVEETYSYDSYPDIEAEEEVREQEIEEEIAHQLEQEKRYLELVDIIEQARSGKGYSRYLQTRYWKITVAAARVRAQHKCQNCGSGARLEVHHKTYARLGVESPDDLLVLCHRCHASLRRT